MGQYPSFALRLRWFVWACVFAVFSPALHAQSVTTSAITGRVTGELGQPLPGVQVVVTNQGTGRSQGVLSRVDGRYFLPGLLPGGQYSVVARSLGYAEQTLDDVRLNLGEVSEYDFSLTREAITLAGLDVVVDQSAVIAPSRTGPARTLNETTMQTTPTISRNFTDYTRLVPQLNTSTGTSAGGRNNRFNNIQIDGAVNNDLFGLSASGTPGGGASARPITLEAIQEVQVVMAPMDVRQGGFTGAGINAVTRSGTNEIQGTLAYFTRSEDFVGRYSVPVGDTASNKVAAFGEYNAAFSLGGPIVADRAHFFVAGELSRRSAPIGFTAGREAAITTVDAQRIQQVLRDRYAYEAGDFDEANNKRDDNNLFARLDFTLSDDHRLTLRHNYVDAGDDNLSRSNSQYRFSDQLYRFQSVTNSTVAQLNSTLGNELFNELRIGYQTIRDERALPTDFPAVRVTVPGGNIFAGHEQFSGGNALDQDIIEITNDLTLVRGAHSFTLGTSNQFFEFSNFFVRNRFGYYEFASIGALETGAATRFEYSYLLEGGRARAEFPVQLYSAYLQDIWQANDNLRLTGGIRVELPGFPDSPGYNELVEQTVTRDGAPVRTDAVPEGNVLFNPRLGFNWDVTGDQATQLRGGIGLFSGRSPGVWISNVYGNTGLDYARFTCTGTATPAFVADPDNQPRACLGTTSLAANEINTIDPGFKLPQVLRYSLAIDRQLPLGLFATLEGLYTQALSDVLPRQLLLGEQVGTIEGRVRWSRTTAPFSQVIDITNTDKNKSYSLTAQLERPFAQGWSASAAYTYSRADDVNSMTSSQALSNWQFNPIVDQPNDPTLRPSNFEVPHRLILAGLYELRPISNAPTRISFVYTGESGRPYSFTYGGAGANADVNSDGSTGNDLVYVPASVTEIRFAGEADQQAMSWYNLNNYIESVDCLRDARGTVLERNACREPATHRLDFRLSQQVPTIRGQSFEVSLDIINFGNLLNRDWGLSEFVTNQNDNTVFVVNNRTANAAGRVLMSAVRAEPRVLQVSNLSSRYQFQLGVHYAVR